MSRPLDSPRVDKQTNYFQQSVHDLCSFFRRNQGYPGVSRGILPRNILKERPLGNAISSVLRCICDIFYSILLIVLMRKGMIMMKIFNKVANVTKLFAGRSSLKKG